MPVVQTTIIEGYDDATKARLLKGMTRVVLSVMAAKPDGVVTMLNELKPSSYARGGVSRVPGPPLPPAIEVVQQYAAALKAGNSSVAREFLLNDAGFVDGSGKKHDPLSLLSVLGNLDHTEFDEALTDEGSIVYARGAAGRDSVERFHVHHGRIVSIQSWGGKC